MTTIEAVAADIITASKVNVIDLGDFDNGTIVLGFDDFN